MAIFEIAKKWNLVKKIHEIDLFDFMSFFSVDFFKFSGPLCTYVNIYFEIFRVFILVLCPQDMIMLVNSKTEEEKHKTFSLVKKPQMKLNFSLNSVENNYTSKFYKCTLN